MNAGGANWCAFAATGHGRRECEVVGTGGGEGGRVRSEKGKKRGQWVEDKRRRKKEKEQREGTKKVEMAKGSVKCWGSGLRV